MTVQTCRTVTRSLLSVLVLSAASSIAEATSSQNRTTLSVWPLILGLGFAAITALAGGRWWAFRRLAGPSSLGDYLRPDGPARGYLGVTRTGAALRPEESRRCQHVLVVSDQPGEAARRYTQPNLLLDAHDGVSVVLFDLHADVFPEDGSIEGGQGPVDEADLRPLLTLFAPGHDVQVFDPFGAATLRYPLLQSVQTPEEIEAVAAVLLADPAQTAATSESRAGQALLGGLLLDAQQQPFASLRTVLALIQGGPDTLSAHLARAGKVARQRTHLYFSLRQEQQVVVAEQLARSLAVFADPALDAAIRSQTSDTQASSAHPSGYHPSGRPGEELDVASALTRPVAIYLRLPVRTVQTPSGAALLRLLQYTALQDLLRAGTQAGGAPPQHVAVYLRAASAATALLPSLPETLAALRLTRVACTVIQGGIQGVMHRPDQAQNQDPGSASGTADSGLYGHVLTFAAQARDPADLYLADGRRAQVWLPALRERRLGPLTNPLYEGARQALPESTLGLKGLLSDLVLERQLRSRAMQAISQKGTGDLGLSGLMAWVDALLLAEDSWHRQGDLTGPLKASVLPGDAQAARWTELKWTELNWTAQATPDTATVNTTQINITPINTAPMLSPLGLSLLSEDRRRMLETRLPATDSADDMTDDAADRPEDVASPEFENPVEVRQTRLLSLLAKHRDLTPAQFVAMTELPETTVRRDLGVLEENGLVQSARIAGKRRYKLVPKASSESAQVGAGPDLAPARSGDQDEQ